MRRCPECGAALPERTSCREMFHELLRREHGLKTYVRARLTLEMVMREGPSPGYVEDRVTRGSVWPVLAGGYGEEYDPARRHEPVVGFKVTVTDLLQSTEQSHEAWAIDWSRAALVGHERALAQARDSRSRAD